MIVGIYLLGTLKDHWVMDEFLYNQFRYHLEVSPHIPLYLFEHWYPWVEVVSLKQIVKAHDTTIDHMEKELKDLRSWVDLLIYRVNWLSKK